MKFRSTRLATGPMKSVLADEEHAEKLPWQDVIIDVQGPFTKADTGDEYILSYHCTCLKVPKLEPFKALQQGYFSRALMNCVMKSRVIPRIVRSDRGPEMQNAVQDEFLAICGCKRLKGAALTPRHQGMNERGHQENLTNHLILIHAVCNAYPQEWAALIPVVECIQHAASQSSHGFSAHDLSCACSIVSDTDARPCAYGSP